MGARVPSHGNAHEGRILELPGPGETDRLRRGKEPLLGALALLGLMCVFLFTLAAAIHVTKDWHTPGSSTLENPVALFMAHQKGWGMGPDTRLATAPAGGRIADRAGNPSAQWSIQHRMELVLRLLRGEPSEALALEAHVPVRDLESWRRQFVAAGQQGLQGASAGIPQHSPRTNLQ